MMFLALLSYFLRSTYALGCGHTMLKNLKKINFDRDDFDKFDSDFSQLMIKSSDNNPFHELYSTTNYFPDERPIIRALLFD